MLKNANKRPSLCDLTNVEVDDCIDNAKCLKLANSETWPLMPKLKDADEESSVNVVDVEDMNRKKPMCTQNIHPILAMHKCDGKASSNVSWTQLQQLLNPEEEDGLYNFLTT